MKKLFLICLLFMTGCASYSPSASFDVEKLKTNEILGAGYEHLDGKLFSVFCGGNGYASYDFVKTSCMRKTAQFVHDNGYQYFFMVSKDGDTSKYNTGYILDGMYIPYEVTKHSQSYVILLITEEEKTKYSNFYRVSDYYTEK